MNTNQALRERFTEGGITTASGPKVIQLCYERLERDLSGALDALAARDIGGAHELLVHAQDIVHELLFMLDLDAWEHAPALASIYRYVLELLTRANMRKGAAETREARALLGELGEAFAAAALQPVGAGAVERGSAAAPREFSARA